MNRLVKSFLFWSGALIIIFVFCKNKSFFVAILWILAWGWFVGIVQQLFDRGKRIKTDHQNKSNAELDPRFNTPQKACAAFFNYRISNLLLILNPFLMTESVLQMVGVVWEKFFGRPALDAAQYKQKVNYVLPVAGEWRVLNGGVTKETSHSWNIPSQRFAYDLVKYGENGCSFNGDGRKLDNYFCFDAPIFAPADGVVVKVRDGIRDAPYVGTLWVDWLTRSVAGNSVLIKHAEGEYCLLAHLKRGSVQVKVGEAVKQGQEIGRCGDSGNSTEPHLHFQFQDGISFYFNSGLPMKFVGFSCHNSDRKDFVEQGYISKNAVISHNR